MQSSSIEVLETALKKIGRLKNYKNHESILLIANQVIETVLEGLSQDANGGTHEGLQEEEYQQLKLNQTLLLKCYWDSSDKVKNSNFEQFTYYMIRDLKMMIKRRKT